MSKAKIGSAPFLHNSETTFNIHIDLLIGLIAVLVISIVQNGLRALSICLLSAFSAWVVETLGLVILKRRNGNDLRTIAMGMIIALICPVTVPVWLPVSASILSVLFIRVLLGVNYKTLFITPVIAWLYMLSIAPSHMTTYPAHRFFGAFPLIENINGFAATGSIAQLLQSNQMPSYNFLDLLSGNYPGGMGTTCIFVILCTCLYFVYRKSMAWQVSLSMIITVVVFALVFNRTSSNLLFSVLYELTSSSYIFAAVFIAGDIINAPMQSLAKIIYGVLIGVLTMLFRYMGLAEHCVAISLFIVNLLCEFLDFVALKININKTRKKFSIKE